MSDKYITTDNLSTFKSLIDNEIDEKISQAVGGPVVTFVDWTPTGYTVQVSFTNGSGPEYWQSTKIYDNYGVSGSTIIVASANEIGSIATMNGSTTVTTTTGKLLIIGTSSVQMYAGNGMMTAGEVSIAGYMKDDGGYYNRSGVFQDCYSFQIDSGTLEYTSNHMIYALTVNGNGTVTDNGVI